MTALIATVLGASLLGSAHCAGMCGGFVAFYAGGAASLRGRAAWSCHLAYNGGRLAAYATLGGAAGLLGAIFVQPVGDCCVLPSFSEQKRAGINFEIIERLNAGFIRQHRINAEMGGEHLQEIFPLDRVRFRQPAGNRRTERIAPRIERRRYRLPSAAAFVKTDNVEVPDRDAGLAVYVSVRSLS